MTNLHPRSKDRVDVHDDDDDDGATTLQTTISNHQRSNKDDVIGW